MNITSKVDSRKNSEQVYNFYIKRSLDYLDTTLLRILCIPLLIVISLLIKLDSPGSIFYKQQRVSLNKECFYIWKLRTMTIDTEVMQSQLELKNDITGGYFSSSRMTLELLALARFFGALASMSFHKSLMY